MPTKDSTTVPSSTSGLITNTLNFAFARSHEGFNYVSRTSNGRIHWHLTNLGLVVSTLFRIVAGIAFSTGVSNVPAEIPPADNDTIVWKLEDAGSVGGHPTTVFGAPRVIHEAGGAEIRFDGEVDGLIVPTNPLAGWRNFTVEVLLRPALVGGPEQRFIHLEDDAGRRLMFETRLTNNGEWALDTYLQPVPLHIEGSNDGMLLDRKLLHSAGCWHWAALVFDHGRMTSFVDGHEELSVSIGLTPMVTGRVGIGFRMNRLYWYKGDIREIRFHPTALPARMLAQALPQQ
jgi:hypothetical protein